MISGCASLPRSAPVRALFVDLYKNVQLAEDSGWIVDRVQLEHNLEPALHSVCRTTEDTRRALARYLEREIDEAGGPASLQYIQNGGDLGALDDVLSLERVAALLEFASKRADADCPFFLRPDPDFKGVEGDSSRLVLFLESQGYGALLIEQGKVALAGGGSLRALLGYGLSPRLTLAAGAEFGGSGALVKQEGEAEGLDTSLSLAVPAVARYYDASRIFEAELSPVFRFPPGELPQRLGVRATLGAGLSTMRRGAFMPYILLWFGAVFYPSHDGGPASTSLRLGTRVGLDWDP